MHAPSKRKFLRLGLLFAATGHLITANSSEQDRPKSHINKDLTGKWVGETWEIDLVTPPGPIHKL